MRTNKSSYLVNIIITCLIMMFNQYYLIAQGSDCASASSITSNTACTNSGYSIGAGNSGTGTSSCVSSINDDAWYQFTATGTISTIEMSGSNKNIAIVIYSGTCAGLTEVGCGDLGTTNVDVVVTTVIGDTYYARIIRTQGGGGVTTGNICIYGVSGNLVMNDDFSSGVASWDDCSNPTEILNTGIWHGGPAGETFAEIDAGANGIAGGADDVIICQNISGFVIGDTYEICMDVMRRPGPSDCVTTFNQPGTVTATVNINNSVLNVDFSQSNTVWEWTTVCFNFTATLTTQQLTLTPNDDSDCGMLISQVTILPISLLPVDLVGFKAVGFNQNTKVNWQTYSELNNDYFIIERSSDGNNWEAISTIEGAGNSSETLHYTFMDEEPFLGLSYYRLKQVDFDGTTTFSNIEKVWHSSAFNYDIFPNPTENGVTIRINNKEKTNLLIQIYNLRGEIIDSISSNGDVEQNIELPEELGLYFIKISNGDLVYFEKVIKK